MHIGIFSDVHDNLANLDRALGLFADRGITTLIFCGDFCSPIPARRIAAYEGTVHCVFGNGDGDRLAIYRHAMTEAPNLVVHGEHAELDIDNRRLAVTHYPLYGSALARTGDYHAVFSGHTHESSLQRVGDCLWLNPGEVLGWKGPATCAIYDTALHSADIVPVDPVRIGTGSSR